MFLRVDVAKQKDFVGNNHKNANFKMKPQK